MTSYIGYHNLLDTGTVSASTEAAASGTLTFVKENAYNYNTIDQWKPTAVPANLVVDMTTSTTCDYFFVAAHDLGTNSSSIILQYSSDNFVSDINDAFTTISPTNDLPIFKSFTQISARYWRVRITNVISSLGFVLFGDRLELPLGMPPGYTMITESRLLDKTNKITQSGQFAGSTVELRRKRGKITMRNLTQSWVRTYWDGFADHAETKPFAWQWDDTNYPNETSLVWVAGDMPAPKYTNTIYQDVTLDVEAI